MSTQKKPSPYKQGEDIKNWLDKTGPIFLKDVKKYVDEETYNAIYKAYWDAAGATSVERLKKFKVFEDLLNKEIFNEAEKGMAEYNAFVKKHPEKAGVFYNNNEKAMFDAYDSALKFKKSMPTKEHNYERISLDHYVENNGQGYTPEDMKYLAGLYGLDYENAEDRSEFNKAIAKVTRQKKIEEIMDESTLVNFVLPVAKEYAKRNIDNLQGDFSDKIADIPGTLRNNPGLAAAVVADAGTNAAMFGIGGTAGKRGLAKAGTYAYNYAAAPAIREASHVMAGNKDIGQGALDFVVGGIGTNVATPKMLNALTVRPTAGAWRWAEGKGAASKTMQQKVDEAARKATKTENDMFENGQVTNMYIPGGKVVVESEVTMRDKQGRPLYDVFKDTDGKLKYTPKKQTVSEVLDETPDMMQPIYATKNKKTGKPEIHQLTKEQVHDLKLGKKVEGVPENLSFEDIIPYEEAQFMLDNYPLVRKSFFGNKDSKRLKAMQDQLDHDKLDKLEGYTGYTPLEYAISTGKPESRYAYADRKIKDIFGTGLGQAAQSYGMNALGRPEYGGRLATGTMNIATGFVDPDQRWKYTYGGDEKDATTEPSKNELALYTLQYKKFLEEPEYYPEPERPDGYSAESIEKLKQSIKSVFGSKK